MPKLSGFTLLHKQPPPRPFGVYESWDIVDIRFGRETDWELSIRMEGGGQTFAIRFENVVSFRSQDDLDMLDYHSAMKAEGALKGTIFAIDASPYKTEFSSSNRILPEMMPLTHYLVVSPHFCVEVLTGPDSDPTMSEVVSIQ